MNSNPPSSARLINEQLSIRFFLLLEAPHYNINRVFAQKLKTVHRCGAEEAGYVTHKLVNSDTGVALVLQGRFSWGTLGKFQRYLWLSLLLSWLLHKSVL